MNDKILKWLLTGQVGLSSKTMACCFSGIKDKNFYPHHPYDPDDLNRCLLFLQAVPEARGRMDELRALSPEWNALVENWDKIERTFINEAGLDWCKCKVAYKTYSLMDKILNGAKV